jgi:RHS repeat-associated protein
VTTVELGGPVQLAGGIGSWDNYDEYGVASSDNNMSTGLVHYGWLGGHERATSGAGLVLMGSRLYNSTTGLFTSTDPAPGGNSNDYTYPTDPVNQYDLDGRCICFITLLVIGGYVVYPEVHASHRASRAGRNGRGAGGSYRGSGHRDTKHLDYIADRLEKVHRNSRKYQGRTIGYSIYYRFRGRWHVWKYGVSSAVNCMARPNRQLSSCRKMMKTRCETRRVLFFGDRARALDWESGKVAAYRARYGVYPPGRWVSGR